MKKIQTILCIGIAAISLASCASYTKDGALMSLRSNSINTYVAADLDYENARRVSAEVETKTLFGFIQLVKNGNKQFTNVNRYKFLNKAERQALYRAKENSGMDIILEPEFSTEKHKWFFGAYKTRKVTVTGWGVKMLGIKEDKTNPNP